MPTHAERRHHIDLGGLTPEPEPKRLRVTLELNRSDDPMLFDALIVLGKGRRRVARLRTLAHDGLMMTQPREPPRSQWGPRRLARGGRATGSPRTGYRETSNRRSRP